MVQYVGDVAIYVRPNKLDRFDAVRSEIKEAARSVVSALFRSYELKAQPGSASELQYDKIALVGHSLGSVIAYDTLNRLMLDDWLCEGALQVAQRTATMVTFGSPLNKTAFLFYDSGERYSAHSRTIGFDGATIDYELSKISKTKVDQFVFAQRYRFGRFEIL